MKTYPNDADSFVRLTHGDCHYRIDGPDGGIPLLLIHGATVPGWEFDLLTPFLVDAGFRTIRADLYGHGYSARPAVRYNLDLFRVQFLELLDALKINSPAHALGHSLGAAVVASLANRHPQRFRQIILAAPLVNFEQVQPIARWLRAPLVGELLVQLVVLPMLKRRRSRRYRDIADGRFVDKFKGQLAIPGFAQALLSLFREGTLGDQSSVYRDLNLKDRDCLLIRGSKDALVPAQQIEHMRSLLPNASVNTLDDMAHAFMLTHPSIVAGAVIEFLNSSGNTKPSLTLHEK